MNLRSMGTFSSSTSRLVRLALRVQLLFLPAIASHSTWNSRPSPGLILPFLLSLEFLLEAWVFTHCFKDPGSALIGVPHGVLRWLPGEDELAFATRLREAELVQVLLLDVERSWHHGLGCRLALRCRGRLRLVDH